MKSLFITSSLALVCVLSALTISTQPASAGYSRCKSNRSAYCFRYGDRGPLVYKLIERLRCAGYYSVGNDSWFGPVTDRAVKRLQRNHGLPPDGVVGPQTSRVLAQVCSTRDGSTIQASSQRSSGSALRPGTYYLASKYIEIYKLGNKYCYAGYSTHGTSVASINKISSNPPIYEVYKPNEPRSMRTKLKQQSNDVLLFWNTPYKYDGGVNKPSGDVLACLKSNGSYYRQSPIN